MACLADLFGSLILIILVDSFELALPILLVLVGL